VMRNGCSQSYNEDHRADIGQPSASKRSLEWLQPRAVEYRRRRLRQSSFQQRPGPGARRQLSIESSMVHLHELSNRLL
jgi:hypothetical protein